MRMEPLTAMFPSSVSMINHHVFLTDKHKLTKFAFSYGLDLEWVLCTYNFENFHGSQKNFGFRQLVTLDKVKVQAFKNQNCFKLVCTKSYYQSHFNVP